MHDKNKRHSPPPKPTPYGSKKGSHGSAPPKPEPYGSKKDVDIDYDDLEEIVAKAYNVHKDANNIAKHERDRGDKIHPITTHLQTCHHILQGLTGSRHGKVEIPVKAVSDANKQLESALGQLKHYVPETNHIVELEKDCKILNSKLEHIIHGHSHGGKKESSPDHEPVYAKVKPKSERPPPVPEKRRRH